MISITGFSSTDVNRVETPYDVMHSDPPYLALNMDANVNVLKSCIGMLLVFL